MPDTPTPKDFWNPITFLGHMYDAKRADPLDMGVASSTNSSDEPITLNVFDFDLKNSTSSPVGTIPSWTEVTTGNNKVTESATKNEISTETDYENIFSTNIEVKGGYGPVSAYASTSYSKNFKTTSADHATTIFNEANIFHQRIAIKQLTIPALSANFKMAVNNLNPDIEESFNFFVKNYGTHYLSAARLGGRAFLKKSITNSQKSKLEEKNIDVKAGLEVTFGLGSGSVDTQTANKDRDYLKETLGIDISEVSYVGGKSSLDMKAWKTSVEKGEAPAIVKNWLTPVSLLLTTAYFPNDQQIAKKKQKLDNAIRKYIRASLPVKDPVISYAGATVGLLKLFQVQNFGRSTIEFWGPGKTSENGYLPIGDTIKNFNHNYTPAILKDIEDSPNAKPALKRAVGAKHIFSDANYNYSFWSLVPPPGYKPIGFLAASGTSRPNNYNFYYCVREDLVEPGTFGDYLAYDAYVDSQVTLWEIVPKTASGVRAYSFYPFQTKKEKDKNNFGKPNQENNPVWVLRADKVEYYDPHTH